MISTMINIGYIVLIIVCVVTIISIQSFINEENAKLRYSKAISKQFKKFSDAVHSLFWSDINKPEVTLRQLLQDTDPTKPHNKPLRIGEDEFRQIAMGGTTPSVPLLGGNHMLDLAHVIDDLSNCIHGRLTVGTLTTKDISHAHKLFSEFRDRPFTRKDAEAILGYKKNNTSVVLRKLYNNKLLHRTGKVKSTKYKFNMSNVWVTMNPIDVRKPN